MTLWMGRLGTLGERSSVVERGVAMVILTASVKLFSTMIWGYVPKLSFGTVEIVRNTLLKGW